MTNVELTPEFLAKNVKFDINDSQRTMSLYEAGFLERYMGQSIDTVMSAPKSPMMLLTALFYIHARRQFGKSVTIEMCEEVDIDIVEQIVENVEVSEEVAARAANFMQASGDAD